MQITPLSAKELKEILSPDTYYHYELGVTSCENRDGWCSGGLCPFHHDKRIGNFRVNLRTGGFYCFACGARGRDMIAFHQLKYGLSFPAAITELAEKWKN